MNQTLLFSFQRLDVYRVAKDVVEVIVRRKMAFRGLPGEIGPQMHRAAVSVALNIAEGSGRMTGADQRRHYAIALGSANEVAACAEMAGLHGVDAAIVGDVMTKTARVVQMLLALNARASR